MADRGNRHVRLGRVHDDRPAPDQQHNLITDTLSSYAFTDHGTGLLALATGSLALLGGLRTTDIHLSRTTQLLFGTWSAGLAITAHFPASYADHPDPIGGEIHQYACLIAFLSLPALGFSLLDRLPEQPRRLVLARLSLAATVSLLLFGPGYALPWLLPVALLQRITLIIDVALLCLVIALVRRSVYLAGRAALLPDEG